MTVYTNAVNANQNGVQTINNGVWTGSSLTQHSVLVGGTSSAITSLSVGATGTLLVGASSADPAFATSAEGDFSFTQSLASSSVARKLSIVNSDTANAGSHAQFIAQTGGTSSGNPMTIWSINGGTSWSAGTNRVNSSSWTLSLGTALGTTDAIDVSTSRVVTFPGAPLPVGSGGTNNTTFTAYSVLCAGTTSTGAFQNVSGLGTAGQVLTSQGASSLPTWVGLSVNQQIFSTHGTFTYTPSVHMVYCRVQIVGGGGGGAGCDISGANTQNFGNSAGGGGFSDSFYTAATIGASQTIIVGQGGAGGAVGVNNGTTGGTTSFGAFMSATGGGGGLAVGAATSGGANIGSDGGVGSGGTINTAGGVGGISSNLFANGVPTWCYTGNGGDTFFGYGANGVSGLNAGGPVDGIAATTYGGGGSGGATANGHAGAAGGAGADGAVVITEYIL